MNYAPILILQMQRMGDLVLSFPLLGWLARLCPGHPIWVLGERQFFEPLMPLSPQVTYFSYEGAPNLAAHPFHMVINLSHRPEAAILAGQTRADTLVGPYLDADERLYIRGGWQLYRASLTHNNRYNRFHWADLNALDVIPENLMLRTDWPLPRPLPHPTPHRMPETPFESLPAPPAKEHSFAGAARIGLFLGASEAEKHPDAAFWAALARKLLQAGHKPVLLGGKAEEPLGAATADLLHAPSLNLCGHFSVSALAHFIAELDLFITPDTGPMHIAAWTGTPTLNLSLGPVNPWETGPFSPGHHILRAHRDCVGCWQCTERTIMCKEQMLAARVAGLVEHLLSDGADGPGHDGFSSVSDGSRDERSRTPQELARRAQGLELLHSARGAHGLYMLERVFTPLPDPAFAARRAQGNGETAETPEARDSIAALWQAWFGAALQRFGEIRVRAAWTELAGGHPEVAAAFRRGVAELALAFAKAIKRDTADILNDDAFWQRVPPLLRPFSGYAHMYIRNARASRESLLHMLRLVEDLNSLE